MGGRLTLVLLSSANAQVFFVFEILRAQASSMSVAREYELLRQVCPELAVQHSWPDFQDPPFSVARVYFRPNPKNLLRPFLASKMTLLRLFLKTLQK